MLHRTKYVFDLTTDTRLHFVEFFQDEDFEHKYDIERFGTGRGRVVLVFADFLSRPIRDTLLYSKRHEIVPLRMPANFTSNPLFIVRHARDFAKGAKYAKEKYPQF